MDAYIKAKIISVGGTRSWQSKRDGKTVTVQDCYVLVGESPRPIQASAEPALSVKAGEEGMYAVDVWPPRFERSDLSITLRARVQVNGQQLRSA